MAGVKRWIYGLLALLSSSFATLLAVLASELHMEVSSNVAYLWFYLGAGIVFCLIGCISLLLWRLKLCGAAIPTWVIKHTAFIAAPHNVVKELGGTSSGKYPLSNASVE
jgi:hypothetical protein